MASARLAADLLGVVRLAVAASLPWVFVRGGVLPLVLTAIAAGTDFVDGIVARRAGPVAYGAVLDNVADIALVLAATGTAAALGLVTIAAPFAIAFAFGAYAIAWARRAGPGPARSRLGHAAGVANYTLALLAAGALAAPSPAWRWTLVAAGWTVVAMNLGAVLASVLPPAWRGSSSTRARATPAAEPRAR